MNTGPSERRISALWDRVNGGTIGISLHWLRYNFTHGTEGSCYFAPLTLAALDCVGQVMPGYAESMVSRLEKIHGREQDVRDYNTILQWFAELLVVDHLVRHNWSTDVQFEMEPTAPGSKKNPEVVVSLSGVGRLGVEVKCPNLDGHRRIRSTNAWQLTSRSDLDIHALTGGITLPRDNPIKDFLVSSDDKFKAFRAAQPDFRSVLVIVWGDYVNEPVSALLSPNSGLLTKASFHRNVSDERVRYPNVDAVVLVRHQHQLRRGMANLPPLDERRHFLDYGMHDSFPPNALIPNPDGQRLQRQWIEALGAWNIDALSTAGAEYRPGDVVMWI